MRLDSIRLVVVDPGDEDVRAALEACRTADLGVAATRASSVAEASAMAAGGDVRADLILAEMVLPDGEGPGIVEALQSIFLGVPIICLSRRPAVREVMSVMRAGAVDVVDKAEIESLGESVRRAISSAAATDSALTECRQTAVEKSGEAFFALRCERDVGGTIVDFRFVDVNVEACRLIGLRREDILDHLLCELLPANRSDHFLDHYIRAFEKGSAVEEEVPLSPKKLQTGWIRHQIIPLSDGVAVWSRDITAVKAQERDLRARADLLNRVPESIIIHDLTGHILFWNRTAESMYGWPSDEVVGQTIRELLHPRAELFGLARDRTLKHRRWQGTLTLLTRHGHEVTVESHWFLLENEFGLPASIMTVDSDIAGRIQLQNQLVRYQRVAGIRSLAGGIALHLNNTLTPILMAIPLLRQDLPKADFVNLLSAIQISATRGAEIVKRVLSFGQDPHRPARLLTSLDWIREIVYLMRETFPRNIQILDRIGSDLWPIEGASSHLQQMLLNLCLNSRTAMPDGGQLTLIAENVRVDESKASRNAHAEPGPHVRIEVTDTGHGIEPSIQEKIFDPFFTTRKGDESLGLGLSTVLEIVRRHEGFLNYYTQPDEGTTFEIYLPAVPEKRIHSGPEPAGDPLPGKGELILVVDDEEPIRMVAETLLLKRGYRVIVAEHGRQGLRLFKEYETEIRVVITDIIMPEMDGITFIEELKKRSPGVKIIAMSGFVGGDGQEDLAGKLTALRVDKFLSKPFPTDFLLSVLQDLLK